MTVITKFADLATAIELRRLPLRTGDALQKSRLSPQELRLRAQMSRGWKSHNFWTHEKATR